MLSDWQTPDGFRLHARHWSLNEAKALICLVHGMGEHCGRYDHLAAYYAQHGIATLSFDLRGHGRSDGKRGHVKGYDYFLNDIDLLLQKGRAEYPNIPIILYGHSMGGNLVLNHLLRRQAKVDAVVTTGAWIKLSQDPPALLFAFAKLMRNVYPGFSQPSKLDAKLISTVPEEVTKYVEDPLVHDLITSATAVDVIKAGQWLLRFKGESPLPLLTMHGSGDQITDPAASRSFAAQISGPTVYKEWEGMYHEIHNEAERGQVFDFTLNWLKKYLPL